MKKFLAMLVLIGCNAEAFDAAKCQDLKKDMDSKQGHVVDAGVPLTWLLMECLSYKDGGGTIVLNFKMPLEDWDSLDKDSQKKISKALNDYFELVSCDAKTELWNASNSIVYHFFDPQGHGLGISVNKDQCPLYKDRINKEMTEEIRKDYKKAPISPRMKQKTINI